MNVFIYLNTDSVQESLFEPASEELIVNVKRPFCNRNSCLPEKWSLLRNRLFYFSSDLSCFIFHDLSLIFHIVEVMSLCCFSFASIPRCCVSSGCRQVRHSHLEVRSMINLSKVIPVIPQIHSYPSRLPLDHVLRMPGTDFQRSYHSSYAVQVVHI